MISAANFGSQISVQKLNARCPNSQQNLLAFIQEASRTKDPDYAESMSTKNVIDGLVNSANHRKGLLELASKLGLTRNPSFREALYADEEGIERFIIAILNSESGQAAVAKLGSDSAQRLLDIIQTVEPFHSILDKGFLITQEHSLKARKMIQKLSVLSNELPDGPFVNVTSREEHATSGGTFSDIYKGHYNGEPVAMKVIRTFHRGAALHAFRSKFYQVALVWQRLIHPNILPFLGVDRESFSPSLVMVLPWMEHGSVVKYFGQHGSSHVNEMANVLINDERRACLADFGLLFLADASLERTPQRVGGLRWMAPELIDPVGFGCQSTPTTASDVYAFGCVIFELYTGQPPFTDLSDVRAMFAVVGGKLPKRPTDTKPAMKDTVWELAIRCWGTNHATRPTIEQIVQDMSGIVEQPAEVELEKDSQKEPQQLRWPMPTLSSAHMEDIYPARAQSPSPSGCSCACTRQEYQLVTSGDVSRPISMQSSLIGQDQRMQHNGCSLCTGAHNAAESAEGHHPLFPGQGFNQSNEEKDAIHGMNIGSSLAALSASQARAGDTVNESSPEKDLNLQGEAVQNFGMAGVEIPNPEQTGVGMKSQSAPLVVPGTLAGENMEEFTVRQISDAETNAGVGMKSQSASLVVPGTPDSGNMGEFTTRQISDVETNAGVEMKSHSASLVVPGTLASEDIGEFTARQISDVEPNAEMVERGEIHSGPGHPKKM
ncbi:kinase-like domain-containing protein [Mycena epipterygia]|nr:kinase-like domain-containing protein [Mycena epipterygia]